jgi:outer membrane protein TolC
VLQILDHDSSVARTKNRVKTQFPRHPRRETTVGLSRIVVMPRASMPLVLLALAVCAPRASAASLTAAAYVKAALAASPEVRQADESWRGADDSYKAQLAAMILPTLAFTGQDYPYGDDPSLGYARHGWRMRRSDMTSNATVNWNLFNGFQDLLKTRVAAEARDSALKSLDAARQDRAYAALQAFYALDARARLRDVAREDLRAQEDQYHQTQGLYRDGLKGLADLYKSETEWHASEIRLVSADGDYKAALEPFNALLDRAPWEEAMAAAELTPGATDLPRIDDDAAKLASRRAEIVRALSDADKAASAEKQSLVGLFPTLALNATWNRQDTATNGLPSSASGIPNPNSQVGLALTLPFGYNGATQGFNYAAARAERRRAKAAADGALRSAREELYAAWVNIERATITYGLSLRQEEIARQGLAIVEAQYRQGGADALRMAQARSDLLGARVQTATALQDIFVNRAAYRRAAGVPLW